jgi:hypothetical protein
MPLQVLHINIFIKFNSLIDVTDLRILMDYSIVHYRNKLGYTTIYLSLIGLKYK